LGYGTIIIDQNCYRIQYDNGKLENLIKSIRFWKDDFKLLLLNLSDLTKEIDINGEKFVPIGKLKNGGTNINEYRYLEWKGYSAIDNEEHETSYDEKTKSFLQFYRGESRMCTKQHEKLEKLLEWHFDIHGLIEKGLAIDKKKISWATQKDFTHGWSQLITSI